MRFCVFKRVLFVCVLAGLPGADTFMLPKFHWVYYHARVNVDTERERAGYWLAADHKTKIGRWTGRMKERGCGGINDNDNKNKKSGSKQAGI